LASGCSRQTINAAYGIFNGTGGRHSFVDARRKWTIQRKCAKIRSWFPFSILAPPQAAFLHGMVKGLVAPFILYGHFTMPAAMPVVEAVQPVRMRPEARSDWEAVGADVRAALSRYGEQQ
jgi:hypothetical protein